MTDKDIKTALEHVEFRKTKKEQILEKLLSECEVKSRKEIISMSIRKRIFATAASIAVLLMLSGTVYATAHWLSAKEVTGNLGSEELSRYFESSDVEKTCEMGEYRFAFLGVAASVKLSEQFLGDDTGDSTYVVVAAEKVDGTPITEETFVASPLIQGMDPAEFNIYSMGGGATYYVENGIYYMIVCCDSIEMFADRQIYLAITRGPDYKTGYIYEESTGLISRNESFDGINALFEVQLDESKADLNAQQDFLNKMKQSEDSSTQIPVTGCEDIDFFLYYDYESMPVDKIEKLQHIGTTIDSNEYEPEDGYYHISYANEYCSGEGTIATELFYKPSIGLCAYDSEEKSYVILEYARVGTDRILHMKHIKFDIEQLEEAKELLMN